MKRILLSLLTYSVCLSAFAQIDTSKKNKPGNYDKWEIIKGNAKAAKSKLFVSLPEDAHWDMTIYAAGSNKVLSNTLLIKEFLLLPGSYDVEVNKIRITGVPVEKGKNTRLKAGVLNVTTSFSWTLYDETQQTVLINAYSEQKRGLPIGKYKLAMNGQIQPVEIKDEFQVTGYVESPYYVITPLEATTAANVGKLSIIIPKDTTIYVPLLDKRITIPYLIRDTIKIKQFYPSGTGNGGQYIFDIIHIPKYLSSKTYEIKLNGVGMYIPVKTSMETRLKAGYLIITSKHSDNGMSANEELFWETVSAGASDTGDGPSWEWKLTGGGVNYSGKKRAIVALPPGEYNLTKFDPSDGGPGGNDVHFKVIIKDGEWVKNGVKQ